MSERERWRRLLLVLPLRRAGKQARGGARHGAVLLAEEEEERKEKKLAENPLTFSKTAKKLINSHFGQYFKNLNNFKK